jgi:predicted ribonuclease toxin of YeeF-YezG toxin-antitoxin module
MVEAVQTNQYGPISKEAAAKSRSEFGRIRGGLVAEWERNTGQVWLIYSQPVISKSGEVSRRVGQHYEAHHVIELGYGGPNEWWNTHPARYPDQHQAAIHRSGSLGRDLFVRRGEND